MDLFQDSRCQRLILACVCCTGWMGVSMVLILLNKHILSTLDFPYPMTVSGGGMAASGALSYICCKVLKIVEANQVVSMRTYLTRMVPVGLCMSLTLFTGNLVYLYLTVSFIQMLKAFTPVITMTCLYLASLETPTHSMIASVLLVALGTAVAAYGEVRLVWLGMGIMLISELCESIRLVMTQFLLVGMNFNPIEGLMYLAPTCTGFLALGAAFTELPFILSDKKKMAVLADNAGTFAIAAVLGFCVNGLAFATIKLASSLTLKVLANVKNALIVFSGVLLFGDIVTGVQAIGYSISVAGFLWYQHLKVQQMGAGAGNVSKAHADASQGRQGDSGTPKGGASLTSAVSRDVGVELGEAEPLLPSGKASLDRRAVAR